MSPFEAGLQPLASASAAGALRDAGVEVTAWDQDLEPTTAPSVQPELVLLSVQQFEALQRSVDLLPSLHRAFPGAKIVTFGQYAQMNPGAFLDSVDGVLYDEPERVATDLAAVADGAAPDVVPGIRTRTGFSPRAPRGRLAFSKPARDLFPDLVLYPGHHGARGLVGNIEASRGCHHKCTYCSVYGAYDGGSAAYEVEPVVADALALAEGGVRHFVFIDAEFFNTRTVGESVMRRIREELGDSVTFELTTRVDHVLDYTTELERLVDLGLVTVTSALEFPSDRILRIFDKGIDVDDMRRAIAEAHRMGFVLNPTFIPFTPWVEYDELLTFEDFLVETGLATVAHPTVLQTRLLLFKGSPLLSSPWVQDVPLEDRGSYLDWTHDDPRVEVLWHERRDEAEDAGAVRCCVKC
ncbi:radical SAM protein [Phycicoccus sp. CSK15P-2]|uniref:radical SAM protein n=1 Tax=Phycicoccus sp. CSK15P-2 TaxID=2807627 RepID=UPI00194FCB8A|nr:radical SAM protein [Phycicoccus sp. CSK15P-2]MBM6405931.1 radical SAM protein [Phycicoccus sp. CSK15P-2]